MGATASKDDAVAAVNAEIEFLEHELDAWIGGLLEDGWNRGVRRCKRKGKRAHVLCSRTLERAGRHHFACRSGDDDLQRPSYRRGSTVGLGNIIASFAWTVHA